MKYIKNNIEGIVSIIGVIFSMLLIYLLTPNSKLLIPICGVLTLCALFGFKYKDKSKKIFDVIIQYRYIIALIVFIVLVILQIHGSSVNYYNNIFTDLPLDHEILFGKVNNIRGDEFNVQLPYYFSQEYNGYDLLSNQMSLSGQNMILGYNAPVLDITLLSKPFTWGYVLLGNNYGLSWYWCSKLILCLLVAFELFMVITKKSKVISFVGSFVFVFSPAMQWWFSPHMYDVFFWGITLIVIGYYFFTSFGKIKWLFTLLSLFSIVGFVLALFPSLQVVVGLVVLLLLVTLLIRDRDVIHFSKLDGIKVIIIVFGIATILGYFILNSYTELEKLFNTAYPGQRVSVGGDQTWAALFSNITTIITPYKDSNVLNNSEVSTFSHFGVLFLILFPYIFYKNEKKKKSNIIVGMTLFIIMMIQIQFMIFGVSETVAKITLLSYVNRMPIAYGFTATIASVWLVYYYINNRALLNEKVCISAIVLFMVLHYMILSPENHQFIYDGVYVVIIGLIGLILISLVYKKYCIAIATIFSITLVSGATVNPVVRGTSAIHGHAISKIVKSTILEEGYWLTTNSLVTQNFLLANGGKVINSVNFYPDIEKWGIIDPEGKYENMHNRYAHMEIHLVNETSYIEVIQPDALRVYLDAKLLDELQIKYILADSKSETVLQNANIAYDIIHREPTGLNVYRIL